MRTAGTSLLGMAGWSTLGQEVSKTAAARQRGPRMKIVSAEPILTGDNVFVRIKTDAGILTILHGLVETQKSRRFQYDC